MPVHRRFVPEAQQLVALCDILEKNLANTSVVSKGETCPEGPRREPGFPSTPSSPGSGKNSACLANDLRAVVQTGRGPALSRNFTIDRAAPRRGAFTHVARVSLRIARSALSAHIARAAVPGVRETSREAQHLLDEDDIDDSTIASSE